ncbi:MAG: hypothetical protein LBP59_16170 [Planctomycetaceae bacterium]|nr:hypothetical protein [Planctomycetaceae bacterium]
MLQKNKYGIAGVLTACMRNADDPTDYPQSYGQFFCYKKTISLNSIH